jgi:hypothetical protein
MYNQFKKQRGGPLSRPVDAYSSQSFGPPFARTSLRATPQKKGDTFTRQAAYRDIRPHPHSSLLRLCVVRSVDKNQSVSYHKHAMRMQGSGLPAGRRPRYPRRSPSIEKTPKLARIAKLGTAFLRPCRGGCLPLSMTTGQTKSHTVITRPA